MKQYLDSLQYILDHGVDRDDRTGVGTRAVFGMQMRYNLELGFPALTTKRLAMKSVIAELIWFIRGSQDINELNALGSTIWNANVSAEYWKPKQQFPGDAGRIYGVQWRHWRRPDGSEIDQLAEVIDQIQKNPESRRLIVNAWNPGELDQMALPPCHILFQFYVANSRLSLHMYQRSCDMFLGVPFNIASYSLLLSMIAQVTNLQPGEFVHTLGDAHIYNNHFDQVREQLSRKPKPLPILKLNPAVTQINDFAPDDVELINYVHDPAIKAPMAV
ncbi:thymidylate synthase [Candidatus Berkelbacteria bacterium]|nr:thymidylate synthase [Candidatus Berkelbacteria bacterium]